MQLQKKISLTLVASVLISGLVAFAVEKGFRSPAKRFAGAYSVKMRLKKGLIEYDVPVWVKPDQEESSLDPILMRDLGYQEKDFTFESVVISGESIGKKKFKKMASEWAFVPDFSKNCCFGVIGQDILKRYEVRFVPSDPVHLEWVRIPDAKDSSKFSIKFRGELKELFTLKKTIDVPYVLNMNDQTVKFEGTPPQRGKELFSFSFVPPNRYLRVQQIDPVQGAGAKKAGLQPGLVITEINHQSVSKLDRWEVEKFLTGEKSQTISLISRNKKEFKYDFKNRRFE